MGSRLHILGSFTLSLCFDAGDTNRLMPEGISGDRVKVMSNDLASAP